MNKSLLSSLQKVPSEWKSASKIYGEAVEYWVAENLKCPECSGILIKLRANVPSIDHVCGSCNSNFQVKAKHGKILKEDGSASIQGAEYKTTLNSLTEVILGWSMIMVSYSREKNMVEGVHYVPGSKIKEKNIVPRKPLSPKARRAGWQGCNIIFEKGDIKNIL
tara:strand:- start:1688 stop:2179 length:492 start_codon:yes stop_codon:yes gene_type:complete